MEEINRRKLRGGRTMSLSERRKEIKESIYWNECDGNAGYKLISVRNVEGILNLIEQQDKELIEKLFKIIKEATVFESQDEEDIFISRVEHLFGPRLIELSDAVHAEEEQ